MCIATDNDIVPVKFLFWIVPSAVKMSIMSTFYSDRTTAKGAQPFLLDKASRSNGAPFIVWEIIVAITGIIPLPLC
jgi:hypothetical protein